MKKIKTLNIIAIGLLVFKVLSYLGSSTNEKNIILSRTELLGNYFGFNLPLIISVVLFIIASTLNKRMKQKRADDMIDSIGKQQ